tara:strand:+ start:440 stop:1063 length:624 start_codon:yes stop_codon:yes gene_type:complete
MKLKKSILIGLLVLTVFTCIHPIYPDQQILQHLGTLFLIIPLIVDLNRNKLNQKSFIGLSLFIVVHIIGARYIYSFVPYNQWSQEFFGFNINEYFDLQRNHYDRFVHFGFGIFLFPIIFQLAGKWNSLNRVSKIVISWTILQTFSMVYELFEWGLTLVMTANVAENYNGQQGDIWDAHKDMALAMLGSSIISMAYALTSYKKIGHRG